MLKVIVTQVHRWVGVPLGVLFLVTLVTGLVVGGADLLRALDGKGQTHRETSIEEDARALEQMTQDVPQIFQAVMPTPRTPFYQARARGETRTYRIGDLELIDHQVSSGFYRLALGLHGWKQGLHRSTAVGLDVRARGLTIDPELAIGDGGLGFWGAVRKVFPKTREQRCWVHKTANVLNKLPKGVQPKAKAMLHDIWMAETQAAADQAFDLFVATFAAKFPAATTCLVKDRDVLLTFYAFPAEHWMHIRTTNPVESTFATVRLRTRKTKGAGSRLACLTMVFKLAMAAQKQWRALNGSQLIAEVIDGVPFVDGVRQKAA